MKNAFRELGISNEIEIILNKNGITDPTPIQERAIPEIVKGKDVIAQAQTGTGKTLAFLLPLIDKIDISKNYIQGLIITPTRELAIQITDVARKLTEAKDFKILAAYGGQDVEQQIHKLKNGMHLVIATPGRLLDHIKRDNIDLGKLKTLVLDEADEMLYMGFLEDVISIVNSTPKTRQTMLFSATMPNEIRSLGKRFMRSPIQIEIASKNVTIDKIKQVVIETSEKDKIDTLCKIIDEYRPYIAFVFCRTKQKVSQVNMELLSRGYNSDELHGDMSQAKRERVMKKLRDLKLQILVATDIAARGIDVEGVTHVINYDIPNDVDNYIHRIGRTGRIGNVGMAITLVTPSDQDNLAMIERKIKIKLKSEKKNVKSKTKSTAKEKERKNEISSSVNLNAIPKKYRKRLLKSSRNKSKK